MNPFLQKCAKIRGIRWILLAAFVGVLLLLLDEPNKSVDAASDTDDGGFTSVQFYTENLEERIAKLCREVHGVSEVYVLLTLDGGSEKIYAEDSAASARDYVILQGSTEEQPVLIREIYPKIRGVAIVCSHGDDSAMQLTITELLSAALGIPSSSIRVAGT